MIGNDIRGEVDIVLDGQSMVLRPSYGAIVAFEKATGQGLIQLAMAADASQLSLDQTAIVVTECVKAWGQETGDSGARNANPRRIGELIHGGGGLLAVLPRVAMVLAMAASGGCHTDGTPKAVTTGTMTETPVDD